MRQSPYGSRSTDIGTSSMYVLIFLLLLAAEDGPWRQLRVWRAVTERARSSGGTTPVPAERSVTGSRVALLRRC